MAASSLTRVARAKAKVRRAEQALQRARGEFRDAIVTARDDGESLAAIARTVGVTRQRIKQIVGD
jgi:DNA-directed RNA polymerase specialized sigma24 family protein